MPDHSFRVVFQPIVELASARTVAYEAFARPRDGTPPLVWFERAWSDGYGIEREGMSVLRTVELARSLPDETVLALNVTTELLAADPEWLRGVLLAAGRPIWLELDPLDAVSLAALEGERSSIATVREPGTIEIVVEGVCAPAALALLRPLVMKISAGQPRDSLLVAARTTGVRLCRANLDFDETPPVGYELGQGWRYGRPRELRHWLDGNPLAPGAAA
jgi:hypothetical protein